MLLPADLSIYMYMYMYVHEELYGFLHKQMILLSELQVGIKNFRRVPAPNDNPAFIRVRNTVHCVKPHDIVNVHVWCVERCVESW